MWVGNFVLAVSNTLLDGEYDNFVTGSIDSYIRSTDTVVAAATHRGDDDRNPYGNINIFVSGRTVSGGSISVTFEKSSDASETTTSTDSIIFAVR